MKSLILLIRCTNMQLYFLFVWLTLYIIVSRVGQNKMVIKGILIIFLFYIIQFSWDLLLMYMYMATFFNSKIYNNLIYCTAWHYNGSHPSAAYITIIDILKYLQYRNKNIKLLPVKNVRDCNIGYCMLNEFYTIVRFKFKNAVWCLQLCRTF